MSQSTKNTNKTNLEIADRTNQANLDIAQMSNDYNMAMLDKQIAEQWKMWTAENEYNSPEAQKERLLAAGFNPYMEGVDAGSASSMSSPSAQPAVTPTMVGATMQADPALPKISMALDAVAKFAGSIGENMQAVQQLQKGAVDVNVAKQTELAQIKLLNANADVAEIGAKFEESIKSSQEQILFNQATESYFRSLQTQTEFNFLEPRLQLQLAEAGAVVSNLAKDGKIKDSQITKLAEEIYAAKRENRVGDATENAQVRTANAQAATAEANQGAQNEFQLIQDFLRSAARAGEEGASFWDMIKAGFVGAAGM